MFALGVLFCFISLITLENRVPWLAAPQSGNMLAIPSGRSRSGV
jgi:hypothetical protein